MNIVTAQPKLNARRLLFIASILYLLNAGIGTIVAVQENLPSVTFATSFISGKTAWEDFIGGNGTALSPPLYLCIVMVLLLILAFLPKWLGTVGIVGLTILGVLFLLGELAETVTYQALNPATFNLPVALVKLIAIVLVLLIIALGGLEIVHRRQAYRQRAMIQDEPAT
jgi:hypothetical protein